MIYDKTIYDFIKVIECLDGKERIFSKMNNQEGVQYKIYKNGKPFGKTNTFYKDNYPKFITKEMLFDSEL